MSATTIYVLVNESGSVAAFKDKEEARAVKAKVLNAAQTYRIEEVALYCCRNMDPRCQCERDE